VKRIARYYRPGQRYVLKVPGTGRVWWWVILGLSTVLILILLAAGEKSIFKVIALYHEQKQLFNQIEEIKVKNKKLQQQIEDLRTDAKAVERIAREELGMVRRDEIVYRFVSPELAYEPQE